MEIHEIESILEGILFAAGDPVETKRLCSVIPISAGEMEAILLRMSDAYRAAGRGIRLIRMESNWQMTAAPEHADLIRTFLTRRPAPPLSKSALEVLSVVAYFQPTTRAHIDEIRGVDSAGTVSSLVEKQLIEECGRLDAPGRPIQYRTTPVFLRSFGLSSLEELPVLSFEWIARSP